MIARMQQHPLSLTQALGHGVSDKRIAILRAIAALGSISQAARSVGVSYKAAWQALDTLSNLAGAALVAREVGGRGGGGAQLTLAGHELLAAADAMAQARAQVVEQLAQAGGAHAALAHLALRTSMRNQWPCLVQTLQRQGAIVRVQLRAAGAGDQALLVHARITRESAELLGLQPGMALQALCKATALRAQALGAPVAAAQQGNQWQGRVTRVVRGALGDEVAAEVAGGVQMVGFAPARSGLRARSVVRLSLDESAVVLALAPAGAA